MKGSFSLKQRQNVDTRLRNFFFAEILFMALPSLSHDPNKKGSLQFFCQSCNKIKIKVKAIFSDITPMQFFACSVERREIFSSHEIKNRLLFWPLCANLIH